MYRVKRKLRKPWIAKITAEYDPETRKQKRRAIGYFATKTEALQALADFHKKGDPNEITMNELFKKWFGELTVSDATRSQYAVVGRSLGEFGKRKVHELRTADLDNWLSTFTIATAKQALVCLHGMYAYALRYEYVEKDYSKLVACINQKNGFQTSQKVRKSREVFTDEEILKLKENGSQIALSILVAIYSGWRWKELMTFTVEGDFMIGGVKTSAGHRKVPIHHAIKGMLDFTRIHSYATYRRKFDRLMEELGMNHTPHDTRHTTASMLKKADADLLCVKIILGHTVRDMTERVYTHISDEDLIKTIELLPTVWSTD